MYRLKYLSRKFGVNVYADYGLGWYFVFDGGGKFLFRLRVRSENYRKLGDRLFKIHNKGIFENA